MLDAWAAPCLSRFVRRKPPHAAKSMTNEELIKIARRYAGGFAQNDEERARVASLTDVEVKTAAMISFRAPGSKASVEVYLDKDTGEFVSGSFTLGHD